MFESNPSDDRFDRLEALIEAQSRKLRDEIAVVGTVLGGRVDGVQRGVDCMSGRVDGVQAGIDKLGVRLDNIDHHVRIIAEGHGALLDHIVEIRGGIERLEAGQTSLVLRVSAVESRVTCVGKIQNVILTELRGLAAGR